ncbi:MAG: AAA family ATPase [Deltaproteobacteria bacterium]|nr:MAG: AAA family ATPase [Deltaproteobacteria bacterium]
MNLDRFSDRAQAAIVHARSYASDLRHPRVMPGHIVVALLADRRGVVPAMLRRLGADPERLERRLHADLSRMPRDGGGSVGWDTTARIVLEDALRQSRRERDDLVRSHHLLIAAADGPVGQTRSALADAGVTRTALAFLARDMKDAIARERSGRSGVELERAETASGREERPSSAGGEDPVGGEGEFLSQFKLLSQFGRDLTELALGGSLDPVVGRDREIRRLVQVLGRRSKNNPILVGEAGVGKTSVIHGLAHRIAHRDVPQRLLDRRIVQLDMGALVAGTSLRGQFEERLRRLIQEVAGAQGRILLYLDDLHTIVGGRDGDGNGAANLLKPALARGEISLIGTTTPSGFRNQIEKDKALERLFQGIEVPESSVEESIAILRGIKQKYEIHHRVRILDEAVVAAVELSRRYVMERLLPDKAVDLMDEAASRLRMEIDSQPAELDDLRRRLLRIEGEKESLRSAGVASRDALDARAAEAAELRERIRTLDERLQAEKGAIEELSRLKAEVEATTKLVEKARQEDDLERAAELKYGVLRELEKEVEAATGRLDALHGEGRLIREDVAEEDVAGVVAEWTGIPVTRMLEGERQKLLAVEERLGNRVIGQWPAVRAISAAVRRARAGVQERNRPIGNFFFVGPTGVGKTELAKALAEFLFDSEDALIRIDMSEYMEQSKVNTLIGAAFGYVDSDRGGLLTEAVRRRPYSVVLFDEAEKAHPDVFNILLQVLDEGRLSDSQGRTIDFTNTIIIMTSNIGARRILDLTGQVPYEELDVEVREILKDHFKPEFLNRLDATIVFNALDRDSLSRIAEILVRRLQRLLAEQDLAIRFTPEAAELVLEAGFQPEFGARPLRRALLNLVQDPLAMHLLEGDFGPGDTVLVDAGDAGLVFTRDTAVPDGDGSAEQEPDPDE